MEFWSPGPEFLRKISPKLKILVLQWTNFFMENWSALGPKFSAKGKYSMNKLVPWTDFLSDQNFRDSPNSTIKIW